VAVSHIKFNDGLPHGSQLRRALTALESGTESLADVIACMARMIDGDGSSADHFTYMQQRYDFASTADAKSAWEELNSLNSKFSGNGQVSDVNAALLQAFAKFR
jgi:hypothetical protein